MQVKVLKAQTLSVAVLALIALYLLAWYHVPLFFDEVAFRISAGRGFIDGFNKLNLFAQCEATPSTPYLLFPAQYFFSWVDIAFGWTGIRTVPIISIFLLAFLALRGPPNRIAALILCGGFIGISGLGAVISRSEYLTYLHAAAILGTWMLARHHLSRGAIVAIVVVHLAVVSLALFAHMQGLLLMPLSFLACMTLLRQEKLLAVITSILLTIFVTQAIAFHEFRCEEDPALAQALSTTQGNGYARIESANIFVRYVKRAWRFENQFWFRQDPAAQYTPIPPTGAAAFLNIPIMLLVSLNGLLLVASTLVVARDLMRDYLPLNKRSWRPLLNELVVQGRVLWLAASFILIFYSLYDVAGLFYRAHFRNVLTVVLVVLALVHAPSLPRLRWLSPVGWLAFTLCLASTVVAWLMIYPPLAKGYEGVGVSLQSETPAREEEIRSFAQVCGFADDTPRIIVDDATYSALREHKRPIGFNYVWAAAALKPEGIQSLKPEDLKPYLLAVKPSGYVVRCSVLKPWGLIPQRRQGDLCCRRY